MDNRRVFTLTIDTENAAFTDGGDYMPGDEVVRILRDVAMRIESEGGTMLPWAHTILDVNGNDVGRFAIMHLDGSMLMDDRPVS